MLVILQILQRLLQANLTASEDPSMPPAYVARFIRRILANLKERSQAHSPSGNQTENLGFDVEALFSQLEQNPVGMGGTPDEQYW